MAASKNVIWHEHLVNRSERNVLNKHRSKVIWFTGLSASGKSTIAHHLEKELYDRGVRTYVLDGDNVRHGLTSDLGFERADRAENLRRIAEACRLFVDAGVMVLTAFISPFKADRQRVADIIGKDDFIEVHVDCPVEVCENRDPKGMYKKARAGEIKGYTGVDSPYEAPASPDLRLPTSEMDVEGCVRKVLELLDEKKLILLLD